MKAEQATTTKINHAMEEPLFIVGYNSTASGTKITNELENAVQTTGYVSNYGCQRSRIQAYAGFSERCGKHYRHIMLIGILLGLDG